MNKADYIKTLTVLGDRLAASEPGNIQVLHNVLFGLLIALLAEAQEREEAPTP